MWKKLLEHQKVVFLVVLLVVVGAVVAVVVCNNQKSKTNKMDKTDKPGVSSEDEVYTGNGLEVEDTIDDETVGSVDASGDWDEDKSDKSDSTKKDDTTDKSDSAKKDDTTGESDSPSKGDDTKKDDTTSKGDDEADDDNLKSDGTLTDGGGWGEPR